MHDLTPSSPSLPDETLRRPSFRSRLLRTLGPAIAVALAVLGAIAWGSVYLTLHHNAIDVLDTEAQDVATDVITESGSLTVTGHTWDEAHHRLVVDRVDPIFVQVFDERGRLRRASQNIDSLGNAYPSRPLAGRSSSGWIPTLRTFEVNGQSLYYRTHPLTTPQGEAMGFVQVARLVPTHADALRQLGVGLFGLWALLTGGLLAGVGWAARYVLHPLRQITDTAQAMSSDDLDRRVTIPNQADRETAVLGHAFNALLSRIQTHVDALRAFTSNAAHELQTPLTVLRGHVEIALRRPRTPESYQETLHLLDEKLVELGRTLRALLTLTRLDRGAEMDTEVVDLVELVRSEAEHFRGRAEQMGVDLHVETPNAASTVGHPDLLREAVHNLVENAVKYTTEGSVSVDLQSDRDALLLTFRDTGIGIEPNILDQITERFFRSPDAGQTALDGSGLGLSLVKRIAERHGGRLLVASTPGEGSTFVLRLPAIDTTAPVDGTVSVDA